MGARGAARRRLWVEEPVKFEAQLDGMVIPVEVTGSGGRYHLVLGSEELDVDARPTGGGGWSLLIGHASSVADVTEENGSYVVQVEGEAYSIRVEEETRYIIRTRGGTAGAGGQVLKAPMPGRVVLVEVALGQAVQPGDGLVILEAMKMENAVSAPADGVVAAVRVAPGQTVQRDDVLVELA